jgi:hypothetical protein
MSVKWSKRPDTTRLTALLVLTCLVVALMAGAAQAQPSRHAPVAAPITARQVQLDGDCWFSVRWDNVYAQMSVYVSGTTGVGYLNIYRRFATGNLLVSHKTGSIKSHSMSLSSTIDLASGGRYFATWGINSASGNSSGGVSCWKAS